MNTLMKIGIAVGGLFAAYKATGGGKKTRFLGDKAVTGDLVAAPFDHIPGNLSGLGGLVGPIPVGATRLLVQVTDAGPEVLSGTTRGVLVPLPQGGDQRVPFEFQGQLQLAGVLFSIPRSAVTGIERGGKAVTL